MLRFIRRHIPARVWLVWYALHGRPILYRATLGYHGTVLPAGGLIGACRFVMEGEGMSGEPGTVTVISGPLNIQ